MYDKISGMTGTADTEAPEFLKIYNLDVVVIPTNKPVVRQDFPDLVYYNEQFKFKAICEEIERVHKTGQPILVGTISIEKSEMLSLLLRRMGIKHEVLNAKNHAREAMIIEEPVQRVRHHQPTWPVVEPTSSSAAASGEGKEQCGTGPHR